MGFKMDKKDCENVLRGNLQQVLENRMALLGAELIDKTPPEQIYRIQGQMQMLIEIQALHGKATAQLQRQ